MTLKNEIRDSFDKVTTFALAELNRWQQNQAELVGLNAASGNVIYVKDWQIRTANKDTILCLKPLRDPVKFHSKTCAIIYVVNEIRQNVVNTIKIKELDDQIYRFRIQLDVLRLQMQKQRKMGLGDRYLLLNDRYSDTAVKLNYTIAKIKKYCNLTKYNKGILL